MKFESAVLVTLEQFLLKIPNTFIKDDTVCNTRWEDEEEGVSFSFD